MFYVVCLWSVGQGVKTPPFHGGNTLVVAHDC